MDVKIAGGKFRGRKIVIPASFQDFRPTKSMVREAICSSIQQDIHGASVLELCAGSGVFSLELLSRGAEAVTAVELSAQRAAFIEKCALEVGVSNRVSVFAQGVQQYLGAEPEGFHDIIFFDPPYYEDALADCILPALQLLSDYGVLIFEYATDDAYVKALPNPEGYRVRTKKYGKSSIRYYRKSEE